MKERFYALAFACMLVDAGAIFWLLHATGPVAQGVVDKDGKVVQPPGGMNIDERLRAITQTRDEKLRQEKLALNNSAVAFIGSVEQLQMILDNYQQEKRIYSELIRMRSSMPGLRGDPGAVQPPRAPMPPLAQVNAQKQQILMQQRSYHSAKAHYDSQVTVIRNEFMKENAILMGGGGKAAMPDEPRTEFDQNLDQAARLDANLEQVVNSIIRKGSA